MRLGKIALFSGPGRPVEIVEEEVGKPASDEILVRVSMAGICGSDVHRLKGDLPFHTEAVSFGHEAVGVIESLGAEIKTDSVGSQLAATSRKAQRSGLQTICNAQEEVHLHSGTPFGGSENVIAFGCALPTALRGFKQIGSIGSRDDVVIQGSGPVGLACTLLASLLGARSVIVIGDPVHRLEVASSLGATHTLSVASTTAELRSEQVNLLTSGLGASIVVEAAGTADAFPQGLDLLGMNGRYLVMGLYSGEALCSFNPVRICSLNLHIIGSLGIDANAFQGTVDIASKHGNRLRFADLITHRFPLDHLQEALVLAAQGVTIKAVIEPN